MGVFKIPTVLLPFSELIETRFKEELSLKEYNFLNKELIYSYTLVPGLELILCDSPQGMTCSIFQDEEEVSFEIIELADLETVILDHLI